ncbi:hypothetical protein A1395_22135 [Pseudomonas protegens]|uniref:hypothetical protein n=1 Tax=Pseudomonas protegens TaxID=380021 RepID=UPI000C9A85D9|nr:hypothetical protein [Pseudomonas protegens]PNG32209.1 hypothetical protein A1395_22135 [Pseudomonas protegens]
MADSNIERFDELTGLVFSKLYQSFPIAIDLHVMQFADALVYDKPLNEDELSQGGEPLEFFDNTIQWLIESGYVVSRHISSYRYTFETCTLTAKALEVLKAVPQSVGGETLGGRLAAAAADGATGKLKELAGEVLSKGYGLAVNAAMNWTS